jgi:hypothetical protein
VKCNVWPISPPHARPSQDGAASPPAATFPFRSATRPLLPPPAADGIRQTQKIKREENNMENHTCPARLADRHQTASTFEPPLLTDSSASCSPSHGQQALPALIPKPAAEPCLVGLCGRRSRRAGGMGRRRSSLAASARCAAPSSSGTAAPAPRTSASASSAPSASPTASRYS